MVFEVSRLNFCMMVEQNMGLHWNGIETGKSLPDFFGGTLKIEILICGHLILLFDRGELYFCPSEQVYYF